MDERYNNEGMPVETTEKTTEEIQDDATVERSFFQRMPWNRMGLVFLLVGGIMFAIAWGMGVRGGYLFFENGSLVVQVERTGERGGAVHPLPALGQNVNEVIIDARAINVTVRTTTGEPRLVLYGGFTPDIRFENGTLTINTQDAERQRSWALQIGVSGGPSRVARLYLPHNMAVNTLHVDVQSGNVRVYDVEGSNLTIDARSGNIRLNNTNFAYVGARTRSGNIHLDGDAQDIVLYTQTGNVRIYNVQGHSADVYARTGNIHFTRTTFDYIAVQSRTGNIHVNSGNVRGLQLYVPTGNIHVTTHTQPDANIHLESRSGNIRFTHEGGTASTTAHLELSTRSGNVRVNGDRVVASGRYNRVVRDDAPTFTLHAATNSGNIHVNY